MINKVLNSNIELGDEVQEIVSGLKGVVCAITRNITNIDRVAIQMEAKPDATDISWFDFDVSLCNILSKGKVQIPDAVFAGTATKRMGIELGDLVVDMVGDAASTVGGQPAARGVVVGITRYLSGCDRVTIQMPGLSEKGSTPKVVHLDAITCRVVTKGKVKFDLPVDPETRAPKKTGAPAVFSARRGEKAERR